MKTTKKGFTLIELIVVIAIIGVLAAILVPSMLGYVKKSKIQSANSTASSVYKALNSALTELDEQDADFPTDADHTIDSTGFSNFDADAFYSSVKNYFGDVTKIKAGNCKVRISEGMCDAVAVKSGKYYGTYPGVYTSSNYGKNKTYNPDDIDDAFKDAKDAADKGANS